jgi:hypothetical protein
MQKQHAVAVAVLAVGSRNCRDYTRELAVTACPCLEIGVMCEVEYIEVAIASKLAGRDRKRKGRGADGRNRKKTAIERGLFLHWHAKTSGRVNFIGFIVLYVIRMVMAMAMCGFMRGSGT